MDKGKNGLGVEMDKIRPEYGLLTKFHHDNFILSKILFENFKSSANNLALLPSLVHFTTLLDQFFFHILHNFVKHLSHF